MIGFASFQLDSVRKKVKDNTLIQKMLMKHLNCFEFNFLSEVNRKKEDSVLYVARNIISRGIGTRPSVYIENAFLNVFGITKLTEDEVGGISFLFKENAEISEDLIFQCLHIIDPRLSTPQIYSKTWEDLDSIFEEGFLQNIVSEHFGNYFPQLLQTQRAFTTLLEDEVKPNANTDQKVDFCLEFPYLINEKRGLIIEIDGSQHNESIQQSIDKHRDSIVSLHNWLPTLRIKTADFKNISPKLAPIKEIIKDNCFGLYRENYEKPLYETEKGLIALQFVLSPIAISRIQIAIVEAILCGELLLSAESWRIGIIERDVPCGYLAIEDLGQLLENLFFLENKDRKLPKIDVEVFTTPEFKEAHLNKEKETLFIEDCEFLSFDLLIDISMLRRSRLENNYVPSSAQNKVKIRSVHSANQTVERRHFDTSMPINYRKIGEMQEDEFSPFLEVEEKLSYFLGNIFRKKAFREGQLAILNRALQLKNVIGLLPTGGGKSLTYQLASLLQPGITIVIDPLKSLMKDQNDNLVKSGIDATVFINSSLKTTKERNAAQTKLEKGEVLFAFVSPERFQITTFRDFLRKMQNGDIGFSYAVIDEAHCVSEWGHDFRTSYLRLGENIRNHVKAKNHSITFFGLTATASFDVLTDVQRELEIDNESVVRSNNLERKEIKYVIKEAKPTLAGLTSSKQIQNAYGEEKQKQLIELIKQTPHLLNELEINDTTIVPNNYNEITFFQRDDKEEYKHAGLIFCPHKSIKVKTGVESIYGKLKTGIDGEHGYFFGAGDDNDNSDLSNDKFLIYQEDYINNKLNLLTATKAFGMGIDKPNIRYTAHFTIPNSIESFIQEAGRAGRDKKIAISYTLLSDNREMDTVILDNFHNITFKGELKEIEMWTELLTNISFSEDLGKSIIEDLIEDELGIETRCKLDKVANRLDVNGLISPATYGAIDLANHLPISHFTELQDSQAVLSFILNFFQKQGLTTSSAILTWLKSRHSTSDIAGIEVLFEKMDIGKENPLVIGFTNGESKKVAHYFITKYPSTKEHITEKFVVNAAKYAKTGMEFYANFCNNYYTETNNSLLTDEDDKKYLADRHIYIRLSGDTQRAVYRLSIIGVVKDYVVDYANKQIHLTIVKQKEEDYQKYLFEYLQRYYPRKRAEKIVYEEFKNAKGNTNIQKCLYILTHFVYDEIVKKRKEAVKFMLEACEKGLDSSNEMAEYMHLYMNAKYLRDLEIEGINYNLREDVENEGYSIEMLWKYLDITEGKTDNLKHLLGASSRLLTDKTDNPALLLMRSFSNFLLETKVVNDKLIIQTQRILIDAENAFIKGVIGFGDEQKEVIQGFKERLLTYNPMLAELITNLIESLEVRFYVENIQNFNQRFLHEYNKYDTRAVEIA